MTQEKSWIETFYDRDSGLEEHFRKVYFDQIDNPPTLEELQEMYPDIFADFYELYKDCYCPDNPDITAKDMVYEDCLEHHNRMLKAELMSWYYGLPVCNAYKNMSKLIEMYRCQAKKQSKQEFLYEQYTIRRNSINRFIFGAESELIFQDAGWNEISSMFDIDDLAIFQQLYETYMTAFYCKFFSENRLSSRDISSEDIELINTALSLYLNQGCAINQSVPMGNVAGELFDWLNENESTFIECSNDKQTEVQNINEQITIWIYQCLTNNVKKADIDYVNNAVLEFFENGMANRDIEPIKISKDKVTSTPLLSANDLRTLMWVVWYKYKKIRKINQIVVAELLLKLFPASFMQDGEPTKVKSIKQHLGDDSGSKIKKPYYIKEEVKYK